MGVQDKDEGSRDSDRVTPARFFAKNLAGVKKELTAIRNALAAKDLTRDETGQFAERRKPVMAVRDVIKDTVAQDDHASLMAELTRTQELLKASNTGATSFTENSIPFPSREDSGDTPH